MTTTPTPSLNSAAAAAESAPLPGASLGTERADDLVTAYIPLVGHIVRDTMRRVPAHVNRDDLTSAGLLALVQAAQGFDAERGVPFKSYAATRIRGAMLDELRGIDWASRSVRRLARDLDATRNRLAGTLGRVPTDAEVASALGMPVEDVHTNREDLAKARVLSIEAGEDNGGASYTETITDLTRTPEQALEHKEVLDYLAAAVAVLPDRLRHVVEGHYLDERPMTELAVELGVHTSRISQLCAEAMGLIRDAMNSQLDPQLVPRHERPGGVADRRRQAYYAAVATRHAEDTRPARATRQAISA